MTMAMDWPYSLITGLGYSLRVYERTGESDGLLRSRPYRLAVLSNLPVLTAVAWIYTKTPDWMLSYYTDHRRIPKAMQAGLFAMYPLLYNLGYLLAPQLEQVHKGLTKKIMGGIIVYEALFTVLGWKRFSHICTTEEFEAGRSSIAFWHPNHLRWALVGILIAVQTALQEKELKRLQGPEA